MAGALVRSRPNNLPADLTSFVGRRRELSELKRLLSQTRLLTLTGSGGAGKTRLALRAAAEVARNFPDGVWLVSLASIHDPQLVVQALFTALGLQDVSAGWSMSTVSAHLADKHLLLVLDNCEHLLDSCALVAVTLLKACPKLRLLATSRQSLGVTGETRLRVPPLSLPADAERLTPERIATCEAVALLAERAVAVLPSFKVDQANSAAVLTLCRRLDGMPLALELAAVRLEGLTVEQVVNGLEAELPVLAQGARGADPRQQTLDATIGWSYGLLDEEERLLWARLSVFTGGFDAGAAVAVCAGSKLPADHLTVKMASLVEKSIIQRHPDRRPARYDMLETMRQFGRQRLRGLGEEAEIRRRHRDWILQLAQQAGGYDHRQAEAFNRIRVELDNVWSALDFCRHEPPDAAVGVDICQHLYPYWWSRGPLSDVRRILDGFLPLTSGGSVARARCLWIASVLALIQNDFAVAESMADESLRIGRETHNAELAGWGCAAVLSAALCLQNKSEGELLSLAEEMIAYGRSAGLWVLAAGGLGYLCGIRMSRGALDEAVESGEQTAEMCRHAGELWMRGQVLTNLSEVWRRRGRPDQAEALAREGAACKYALGDRRGVALLVETLAWMAADRGAYARAAVLLGYSQRLRESITEGGRVGILGLIALPSLHQARHEACEQSTRSHLGEAAFAKAVQRGATMPDEEAIAHVLEQAPTTRAAASPASPESQPPSTLTRRELEIAQLIAEGLTSPQIASRLFISERTVTTHVTNMLNKLGLSSRIQLASWVTEAKSASPDAV